MSFDPVEGIHYIFDRYSFLNSVLEDGSSTLNPIDEKSSQAEIEKVIKFGRVLYHPDKQHNAGKENQERAHQKCLIIDECEEMLLNPNRKPKYDELLQNFKDNKPRLVSKKGTPIVDLSGGFFDVRKLLSDEVESIEALEKETKAIMNYEEGKLNEAEELYNEMPNSERAKKMYRSALAQEYKYLEFLETSAWIRLGYTNKTTDDTRLTHADDYKKHIEAELKRASDEDINNHLNGHKEVAKIGMSNIPLLLTFNNASSTDINNNEQELTTAVEEMKKKAKDNFEQRSDYVKETDKRKQAVLEKLLKVLEVEDLNISSDNYCGFDVYISGEVDGTKIILPSKYVIDTQKGGVSIENLENINTLEELKTSNLNKRSFVVTHINELPNPFLEVIAVAEQIIELDEKKAQPKKHSSPKTKI